MQDYKNFKKKAVVFRGFFYYFLGIMGAVYQNRVIKMLNPNLEDLEINEEIKRYFPIEQEEAEEYQNSSIFQMIC